MLSHSRLSHRFWIEAVNTTCYLVNRSPFVPLNAKILDEVWYERLLKYSHMRTFGCDAYTLIHESEHSKLDPKLNKCVFQ